MLIFDGGPLGLVTDREEGVLGSLIRLMAICVDVALGIVLVCFTSFHLNMACKNETTIESCGTADPRYDVGVGANLEQVFGCNRWLWLLPVYGAGPVGDGLAWPTRELTSSEMSSFFDYNSDDEA